jgi:hypothetical protein
LVTSMLGSGADPRPETPLLMSLAVLSSLVAQPPGSRTQVT